MSYDYIVSDGFLSSPSLGFISFELIVSVFLARDFTDISLYITISTSVTSGGLVAVICSSQNLPIADGLPLYAFAPSMIALPLLFASLYHPFFFYLLNRMSWHQILPAVNK